MSLNSEFYEELSEVFGNFPDIRAVYLFGSAAAGRMGPSSDLDLGVFVSDSTFRKQKLDLLKELTAIGLDRIDLVILNDADLIVQYEAVRPNRVIYATDTFDRGAIYSKIIRKYLDIKPYLERQKKAYKKKLLTPLRSEDQSHGE